MTREEALRENLERGPAQTVTESLWRRAGFRSGWDARDSEIDRLERAIAHNYMTPHYRDCDLCAVYDEVRKRRPEDALLSPEERTERWHAERGFRDVTPDEEVPG